MRVNRQETKPTAPRSKFRPKQIALALLLLLSVGYLGFIVTKDFSTFTGALMALDPSLVALSLLAALVMMTLKALYHLDLCRSLLERPVSSAELLRAYATSQVVRYLPGKVWGVVYQASRMSDISPDRIITANLTQMVNTNLLALGVISGVLGSVILDQFWPLCAIVICGLLVELLHRRPMLEKTLLVLLNRLSRRPIVGAMLARPRPLRATALLVLEWIVYYAMWWALLAPIGLADMMIPATWYAAASLLSILAFVVPGGLGVREALFVTLAGGFALGAASLLALAAVMRLILLTAELACIPVVDRLGRCMDLRPS